MKRHNIKHEALSGTSTGTFEEDHEEEGEGGYGTVQETKGSRGSSIKPSSKASRAKLRGAIGPRGATPKRNKKRWSTEHRLSNKEARNLVKQKRYRLDHKQEPFLNRNRWQTVSENKQNKKKLPAEGATPIDLKMGKAREAGTRY